MQDQKGIRGINIFVIMQQEMDTWKFLSGQNPKGVRGMEKFVEMQH